jgi:hypothetical protein
MFIPLCIWSTRSNVRSGTERPRTLVKIARRPPGVNTRVNESSAAYGSANRFSAAKQHTASKLAFTNGASAASPRTYATWS